MKTETPGTKPIHPNTAALLRFFDYYHLPERLQEVSKRFHDLAYDVVNATDLNGPEVTVCLRKLLEAKDCAVRAALPEAE